MKDIQTSPRIKEIKRNRRVKRFRFVILLFIFIFTVIFVLAFFSFNQKITINQITVEGTHVIDKDLIEKEVYKNISGKYFYLFSKANCFIYPHDKIYNNLRSIFPRIESLSISRDNFKTIHIKIVERKGTFLYCGNNIPQNDDDVGENCYFINNDGLIFDKAPYFSGNVYFKYYLNLEDSSNLLGQQMIDVDYFHKIVRFIDSITLLGFKPVYLEIKQDGTNYLYLSQGPNSTVPKIIFKNDNDFDIILDNLSLSMMKKEFANEINSKYNTLLYIDLRFTNKVLYKFQ